MTPGLKIPASIYHDDLVDPDRPSLSSSIAKVLCTQSPLHAWTQHPRLNPSYTREEKTAFDLGTVAHSLLLEGDDSRLVVIDANDWRTNAAKEARDLAYAAGKVPLLAKDAERVENMVSAALTQLAAHGATPALLADGKPEQTIVWEEDGVVCRARLDWLRDDLLAIDDLKTSGRSADPAQLSRTLFANGYDVQARFYQRGVKKLTGVEPEFRFIFVETEPPYALSVVSLAPSAVALADDKVEHAINTWRTCLERDQWPGYASAVAYAEAPGWHEAAWMERTWEEAA